MSRFRWCRWCWWPPDSPRLTCQSTQPIPFCKNNHQMMGSCQFLSNRFFHGAPGMNQHGPSGRPSPWTGIRIRGPWHRWVCGSWGNLGYLEAFWWYEIFRKKTLGNMPFDGFDLLELNELREVVSIWILHAPIPYGHWALEPCSSQAPHHNTMRMLSIWTNLNLKTFIFPGSVYIDPPVALWYRCDVSKCDSEGSPTTWDV